MKKGQIVKSQLSLSNRKNRNPERIPLETRRGEF